MALTIESLYTHTFVASRQTRTADGQGGWTQGWEEIATLAGRLRPASATERTVADQEQAKVTHVLYCATTNDIQRGDWVSGAGKTVEVIAVREPSHADHHYEIDCMEIQHAAQTETGS